MSALFPLVLLCEGVDRGIDVRMLEVARASLQPILPLAASVTIQPSGSKANLPAALRATRDVHSGKGTFVAAIRDRDFLDRTLVASQRAAALGPEVPGTPLAAWPLTRHSMESYLLEPETLREVLGAGAYPETLDHLATARRWTDLVRATLEDLAWRARRLRPRLGDDTVGSRDGAVSKVIDLVRDFGSRLQVDVGEALAVEKLDRLAADFESDGPLWTRVDGKRLLAAFELTLPGSVQRGGPGWLRDALLRHVERIRPPASLVADLRQLLLDYLQASVD